MDGMEWVAFLREFDSFIELVLPLYLVFFATQVRV